MDRPSSEGTRGSSPDQDSASAGNANKRLRIVTRCSALEEFLATFGAFADESSVFIVTNKPRALGLRQPFVIQLKDGESIMRGDVEVIASITDGTGPDGRNGMRLKLLSVDDATRDVHRRLLERARMSRSVAPPPVDDLAPDSVGIAPEARPPLAGRDASPKPPAAAPPPRPPALARPLPPAPPPHPITTQSAKAAPAATVVLGTSGAAPAAPPQPTTPAPSTSSASPSSFPAASTTASASPSSFPGAPTSDEERAPGAAYQLPANPFEGITAEALESFVECTLYEERLPRGEDGQDAPPPSRSGGSLSTAPSASASTAPPPLLPIPAVAPLGFPPPAATPQPGAVAPVTIAPGVAPPTFGAPVVVPTFVPAPPPSAPQDAPPVRDAVVLAAAVQAASVPTARGARPPWIAGLTITAVVSSVASLVAAYMLWGRPPAGPTDAATSAASAATADRSAPPALSTAAPTAAPTPSSAPTSAPTTSTTSHQCRANVRSYPEGASISWNAESLGITPLADTPVPCGPAKVTFELRGYALGERSAFAVVGKAAGVFLRLAPLRVTVEVTSTPPGAQLLVDGRSMGRTPVKVSVPGLREATIVVSAPHHKPWTTKLTPEPPLVTLHADLQKK